VVEDGIESLGEFTIDPLLGKAGDDAHGLVEFGLRQPVQIQGGLAQFLELRVSRRKDGFQAIFVRPLSTPGRVRISGGASPLT